MKSHIIPAGITVAELQDKAKACARMAEAEKEPVASELREEAALYRKWIALLKGEMWTS